jgi:hypothetical protein
MGSRRFDAVRFGLRRQLISTPLFLSLEIGVGWMITPLLHLHDLSAHMRNLNRLNITAF